MNIRWGTTLLTVMLAITGGAQKVANDTAKVKIQMSDGDETEEEDIDLKKIDGKWKVAVNKDN